MSLRQKTLLPITLSLAGLIAVFGASLSAILLDNFDKLEERNARQSIRRAINEMREDIDNLDRLAKNWAAWDETSDFVSGENSDYTQAHLSENTYRTLKINVLLLLNGVGDRVFAERFDADKEQPVPFSNTLYEQFISTSLFRDTNHFEPASGFLLLPEKILLVAAEPVLSTGETDSTAGMLIMGRELNATELGEIEQRTELDIQLYRLDNPRLSAQLSAIASALQQQENESAADLRDLAVISQPVSASWMVSYTLVRDLDNQPALLLRVGLSREIHQQGQTALFALILSLFTAGVAFGALALWLLEKMVISRLAHLSADVQQIGTNNDLSLRVKALGKDELSSLADTINWMLERLEIAAEKLNLEQEKSERLLLNILPAAIAERLKQDRSPIAEQFEEATILFADLVGFTPLSARLSPIELVDLLNLLFSEFDRLAQQFGLEKIKTIGDAYMVAAGLPLPKPNHVEAIAEMGLSMQKAIETFQRDRGESLQIRIGIHTGSVVAGVIGTHKFIYDLWGDTVNTASRMESHGLPGKIHVTEEVYLRLRDRYRFEQRGELQVKGKGKMTTYWLLG
ncbi:MAG: adenylate/guanylate cyclase domain-containing protein [Cyanobacteriota bacterium]|nr:adenylate/guanylate cyclase domain-containing protein [Cyanobacteriota bacterium]